MRLEHGRLALFLVLLLTVVLGTAQGCDNDDDDDPGSGSEGAAEETATPPTQPDGTVPDNDDSDPSNAPPQELIDLIDDRTVEIEQAARNGLLDGSIQTVGPLQEALVLVLDEMPIEPTLVTELQGIRELDDVNPQLVALIDDTLARGAAFEDG